MLLMFRGMVGFVSGATCCCSFIRSSLQLGKTSAYAAIQTPPETMRGVPVPLQ